MKFYFVSSRYKRDLLFPTYKDNAAVISWKNHPHLLSLDYAVLNESSDYDLYLYNLKEEDFSHLRILGIPIKMSDGVTIRDLPEAISYKLQTFTTNFNPMLHQMKIFFDFIP